MGKMVIQILAAVAEAERERILGAQTKAGSSPWRQASGLDGNLITNRPPHWSLSGTKRPLNW
jgi:DNA invertase Pin-like site-specific DNA recombinase